LGFWAKNLGQLGINTMVNTTSHHSHPRSIHGQSMVNPRSTPQQWVNNEKQPTNDHKQYETIKNNAQTTQNNAISKAKEGF
jgi:hypothetical protein